MRILYVQYTNPGAYPPLVRGARLLADAGAEIRMLGVRVAGLDALDVESDDRMDVRLMPAGAKAWQLKAHYARYAAWAAAEGAKWRPDWIYASDVLAAPVAVALATLTGARVVYHEHDAPSLEHQSWAYRRCLSARRRLLHQARVVVTPNAQRSAHLSAVAGGRAVLTVWNCPPRPHSPTPRPPHEAGLRAIYRGSVNADRLPETVVDAIALTPDASLDIVGYETAGSRGHIDQLLARAAVLGVSDRVRSLGAMGPRALDAVCGRADIGLALMPMDSRDENMRHMTGASNKVFEYFACGVAPLVSALDEWRTTFVDAGYALACDPRSAESIAAAFGLALRDRDELAAIAARGWQRLQIDWNYETQFAPVMEALWSARGSVPAAVAHAGREAQCVS